jgi:DNA mismatch repair protein MSH6
MPLALSAGTAPSCQRGAPLPLAAARPVGLFIQLAAKQAIFTHPAPPPRARAPVAGEPPFFEALQLRHPAGIGGRDGASFVPNDIRLGAPPSSAATPAEQRADAARFVLLTGPNMGGKSTLLRQACLAAVLAQVRRGGPRV